MRLYADSKLRIRVAGGLSEEFPINLSGRKCSAFSPLLCVLVIVEAMEEYREDEIWQLLYADDLVLTMETKQVAEQKFFDWRQAVAKIGKKLKMVKTKLIVTSKKSWR